MKRKVLISSIILLAFMFLLNPKVYAKEIIVKTLQGESISIEAESSDEIVAVKEKIYEKDKTPLDKYDLSYAGNRLGFGRTLADYNIINVNTNTTIEISMVYANKITFDANDGIGNMEAQSFTYGKEQEISENTFIREGYKFYCWNTEKDGTGTAYFDKSNISINENITLYAQWLKFIDNVTIDFNNEIKHLTKDELNETQFAAFNLLDTNGIIVFDKNNNKVLDKNGKELLTIDVNQNNKIILAEKLSKTDNIVYTVTENDYKDFTSKGILDIPKEIKIIFAEESEKYKVTFDANGGSYKNDIKTIDVLDIINFSYESFEKPTKNGFEFIGFYTKDGKSYYEIMNSEAGIEENTTFYAQWQEVSTGGGVPGISEPVQPDNTNTDSTNTDNSNISSTTTDKPEVNNPQTNDNIILFVIVLGISIIGLSTTTLIEKR